MKKLVNVAGTDQRGEAMQAAPKAWVKSGGLEQDLRWTRARPPSLGLNGEDQANLS